MALELARGRAVCLGRGRLLALELTELLFQRRELVVEALRRILQRNLRVVPIAICGLRGRQLELEALALGDCVEADAV